MSTSDEHKESPARGRPRWVRVLDRATVATVLLAACVLVFGGFREHVAGVRISFRSWDRLLVVALLLTAIRHAYVRAPSLPRVLLAQLSSSWRSEARREVWPAFVATRLGVLAVGYMAVVTIGFAAGTERFRVSDHSLENLTARWDAAWYLGIVTEGYQWDGNPKHQQNVVFFPAFPTVIRIVGLLFAEKWLVVGLMLALTAFFCALLYLRLLARLFLDPDQAQRAVWLLAAYPFAVYYSAPYTEAFYLLGTLGTFYHVNRHEWWRAGLWGFFVALCRPNGFFIALPVGILVLQQMLRERRVVAAGCAAACAPVLGILTYCLFLYVQFGDPLAWRKGQLAWGRVYVGLWPSIEALWEDRFGVIASQGFYHYSVTSPYDLMYTAAALFVLASVPATMRRFGPAYGIFTAINILPPMLMGGMMSIGRMTSVLFPAFLWLGAIVPARHAPAWIAIFSILQGLIAVLFFTWRPAF